MVLTTEEYQLAIEKTETILAVNRLLDLRTTTESYIIQCLADREIQKLTQKYNDRRSPAYGHNSKVIHLPHFYYNKEAADGLGWDSDNSLPIRCRLIRTDAEVRQKFRIRELEKQLADRNEDIADWKEAALALNNENRRLVYVLNEKQYQIDQLLPFKKYQTLAEFFHFDEWSSHEFLEKFFAFILVLMLLVVVRYYKQE